MPLPLDITHSTSSREEGASGEKEASSGVLDSGIIGIA